MLAILFLVVSEFDIYEWFNPRAIICQKTVLYFVNECDIYEGFNLEATSDRKKQNKKKTKLSCPVSAKS